MINELAFGRYEYQFTFGSDRTGNNLDLTFMLFLTDLNNNT